MLELSPLTQQIIVAVIVLLAVGFLIRWRIKSARAKSGACPKCTIEH